MACATGTFDAQWGGRPAGGGRDGFGMAGLPRRIWRWWRSAASPPGACGRSSPKASTASGRSSRQAGGAPATLPPELTHRPEDNQPKPRQWTVGEVSTALTTLPGEIDALVREGQQELRQLEDPGDLVDAVRQERARNFFKAWGRTFNNRVKLLQKKMPTTQACAPFSAMASGCRAINIALDGLHAVDQHDHRRRRPQDPRANPEGPAAGADAPRAAGGTP